MKLLILVEVVWGLRILSIYIDVTADVILSDLPFTM